MTVTSIRRLKKLNNWFLCKDRIYCINWLIPVHIFLYIFIHMNCCCCCLVTKLCPSLCDPVNGSRLGFAVLHYLPEFARTHVHWVSGAIPTISSLLPPSAPALNLSQHHCLLQWVSSLHQVAKVLALQLQQKSFQIQGWFPLGMTGLISLFIWIHTLYVHIFLFVHMNTYIDLFEVANVIEKEFFACYS